MKPGSGGAAHAHLLMVAVAIVLLPVVVVQANPLAHLPHPAHFQTLPCLLPEGRQEICCWHCWLSQVKSAVTSRVQPLLSSFCNCQRAQL